MTSKPWVMPSRSRYTTLLTLERMQICYDSWVILCLGELVGAEKTRTKLQISSLPNSKREIWYGRRSTRLFYDQVPYLTRRLLSRVRDITCYRHETSNHQFLARDKQPGGYHMCSVYRSSTRSGCGQELPDDFEASRPSKGVLEGCGSRTGGR